MKPPILDRSWQHAVKRAVDVAGGTVLLVASLPLLAACIVAIRLTSHGPALYTQRRIGRGGTPFVMYKLRTMRCDADAALAGHLAASPDAREEWRRYGRLARDPRVAGRLGRWLRRSSLDELPQLWNVVMGDMSLVGPRPLAVSMADMYPRGQRARRESVRPGLTGLWQISGRSELDFDQQLAIDDRYVENWSLWTDVRILSRTPAALLSGRGAY